ncbi:MAG: hypothetical protein HY456_02655 [Parcubacteria group bacterium]|nr:hypothetical protein [Parcubacteria group bacterium]
MKTFFIIVALAALSYTGFRYLSPETQKNIKAQAKNSLAAVGLSDISPGKLLPPLKAKIAPLAERLKPENPSERRAQAIEKLDEIVANINRAALGAPPELKSALENSVKESTKALETLKTENEKSGVLANAANGIINLIAPSPVATLPTFCANP